MPPTAPRDVATPPAPDIDEAGVDRAQIRAMLALSPEQRLHVVEEYLDAVRETREASSQARSR